MSKASNLVRHRLTLHVVGPDEPVPADAELRYDPTDPYAVAVAFIQTDAEVVWVFGRELLMKGVSEPAGLGDVGVFPALNQDGRAVVSLMLRSPGGQALAELPTRDVLDFLARTTRVVWPGTEADHMSADAAIEAILVGG